MYTPSFYDSDNGSGSLYMTKLTVVIYYRCL